MNRRRNDRLSTLEPPWYAAAMNITSAQLEGAGVASA